MSSKRTTRDDLDRSFGKVRRCLSFWRRALLVFVVTALAAGPFSITRPRSYRSETVVLYQERIRSADLTGGGGDGPADSARRLGARLREALLSRASLEPIVLELHLYPRVVQQRGLIDAVDEMRKHVSFRAREGDTFEISFEGGSPDEVQVVTERLAESMVKEASGRRAEHARTLKEFVDAESDRNKIELKANEAALANFLALHPEFKRLPGMDAPAALAAGPDVAGGTALTLEQRAARIEAQLAHARRSDSSEPSKPEVAAAPAPAVPPSPEVLAARRDLADKLARFTDKHPDVVAARNRLRTAEVAHAAAIAAAPVAPVPEPEARGSVRDDREALRQQLMALQLQIAARRAGAAASASASPSSASSVAAPPSEANRSVALEVEFRRLQREVNDTRERQRLLDEKQFKASITASSVMNDRNIQVSVLDPAYRPTHAISRPRSTLLGAALFVCLVLAVLTACVSAWLDDRIHDRADLEAVEWLPVVAVIPRAAARALPRGKSG